MPTFGNHFYGRRDMRKIWRYPGVPIPSRLTSRYKVK